MAVKTRAELQADINAVLVDPELHSVTAAMIRQLLIDISDSMFVAEDNYAPPDNLTIESLELTNGDYGLSVEGDKVVGARGPYILHLITSEASPEDIAEKVNEIIATLEGHGLIEENP